MHLQSNWEREGGTRNEAPASLFLPERSAHFEKLEKRIRGPLAPGADEGNPWSGSSVLQEGGRLLRKRRMSPTRISFGPEESIPLYPRGHGGFAGLLSGGTALPPGHQAHRETPIDEEMLPHFEDSDVDSWASGSWQNAEGRRGSGSECSMDSDGIPEVLQWVSGRGYSSPRRPEDRGYLFQPIAPDTRQVSHDSGDQGRLNPMECDPDFYHDATTTGRVQPWMRGPGTVTQKN